MRQLFSIILIMTAATLIGCSGSDSSTNSPPDQSSEAHHRVSIRNIAFSPASLSIDVGDTVTWTNNDAVVHTVTATSGGNFDSGTMNQGDTYMVVFTSAANINYRCEFHPVNMLATLTVR